MLLGGPCATNPLGSDQVGRQTNNFRRKQFSLAFFSSSHFLDKKFKDFKASVIVCGSKEVRRKEGCLLLAVLPFF